MPFDENKQRDLDIERMREHLEQLGAKFDTVQIFVTRFDVTNGQTVAAHVGCGNWFARRGQVSEWVLKQDELACDEAIDERDDDDE